MEAVQRQSISTYTKICSIHFTPTDFRYTKSKRFLLETAVPTVNLPLPPAVVTVDADKINEEASEKIAFFQTSCRFCLEQTEDNNSIRIDGNEWPYSEFSYIFQQITYLQFPVSENCSEFCCFQCIDRLRETLSSVNLFRNALNFWQQLLMMDTDGVKENPPSAERKMETPSNLEYLEIVNTFGLDDDDADNIDEDDEEDAIDDCSVQVKDLKPKPPPPPRACKYFF